MAELIDRFVYDTIDSTMDEAVRLIQKGSPLCEGAFVVSRMQGCGRGRRGRTWQSISGNFQASFFIKIAPKDPALSTLAFLAALVVRDVLLPFARNEEALQFKWPNDVLWYGRKVAGILIEKAPLGPLKEEWIILGVGLNLIGYPHDIPYAVTSLLEFSGQVVRPLSCAEKIREVLLSRLKIWRDLGPEGMLNEWIQHAYAYKQMIRVMTEFEGRAYSIEGTFEGIDENGALLIKEGDDSLRRLTSGDVYFNLRTCEEVI